MATFGRVPVRALADVRRKPRTGDSNPEAVDDDKRKTLQSFTVAAIDVALSLLAPRSLEVGQFGLFCCHDKDVNRRCR